MLFPGIWALYWCAEGGEAKERGKEKEKGGQGRGGERGERKVYSLGFRG